MCKGYKEVNNVNALKDPARKTDLGQELGGGESGKKRIRVLQRADPRLFVKTNDVVVRLALDSVLTGLVPHLGRPIFFLGAAKRIVNGNTVILIFSCRELTFVHCSGHVDALVRRVVEDGAGRVTDVCPLESDL